MIAWLLTTLAMGLLPLAFWYCCCTDTHCLVFSDAFSRNTLPGRYTIQSGSWTVTNGELLTNDSNALIRISDGVLQFPAGVGVGNGRVKITRLSGEARLIMFWRDDDNYWYGQIATDGTRGKLTLWRRDNGVDEQFRLNVIVPGYTGAEPIEIHFCYYFLPSNIGGTSKVFLNAVYAGETYPILHYENGAAPSSVFEGSKIGVATGTTSGPTTFDDLQVEIHGKEDDGFEPDPHGTYWDCPICEDAKQYCSPWIKGTRPDVVHVLVTGSVTGFDCCPTIGGFSGDFDVKLGEEPMWFDCWFVGPFPCNNSFTGVDSFLLLEDYEPGPHVPPDYGVWMRGPGLSFASIAFWIFLGRDQIDGTTFDQTYTINASALNNLCSGTINVRIYV